MALRPAHVPALQGKLDVAHFSRGSLSVWSLAVWSLAVRSNASPAILAALERAHLRPRRTGLVGPAGWIVRRQGATFVFWRHGAVTGALLTLGLPQRTALDLARLADGHLHDALDGSAWDRALGEIRPDGTVPLGTALDLFALAYGPLPGTRRPAGAAGGVPEGSLAARVILQDWQRLTGAQRAAALRMLGITGVRPGKAPRRHAARHGAIYGDPTFKSNPVLQQLAAKYSALFVPLLQTGGSFQPTLKIVAGTTSEVVTGKEPGNAPADALPVDSAGDVSNAATVCRLRFTPAGVALKGVQKDLIMAHEVFHCMQFDAMTPVGALFVKDRDWLIEGGAEWAAHYVKDVSWADGGGTMGEYLDAPGVPLFQRSYDAIGFFGHAADVTGDLWPRMLTILRAPTNLASYAAAGGDDEQFLASWASSSFNLSMFGDDWHPVSPIAPPATSESDSIDVLDDGGILGAAPYALARYSVDPEQLKAAGEPLLHITVQGHGRIAFGGYELVGVHDAWFCIDGDCQCPAGESGTPPPATKLTEIAALALTGGPQGSHGLAELESLETYCHEQQDQPPGPQGPPIGGGGVTSGGSSSGAGSGCTSGCGSTNGDPHLLTFDGAFYDFQAAGEFTLTRGRDGFEVQVRQQPYPGSKELAITTAVALRVGSDRVGVTRGAPLEVRVDGHGFLPGRKPRKLAGGGSIRSIAGQIEVDWPDGSVARVSSAGDWGLDTVVRPAHSRFGKLEGLLGNFDGAQQNDFRTRAGRRLDFYAITRTHPARTLLYRTLADSWRVTPRTSLFEYARGASTRTFTDRRFPARELPVPDISAQAQRMAERVCRKLHIRVAQVLANCILDVASTGDVDFATSGAQLVRTAKTFGTARSPAADGGAETVWTPLTAGGRSNLVVASLATAGSRVVATYLDGDAKAEVVTFTPSVTADVTGLAKRRLGGLGDLGNPALVESSSGGLSVLVGGEQGAYVVPRNADGSLGSPTLTLADTAVEGAAVAGPDGVPLWADASAGTLHVHHGGTSSDLTRIIGPAGSYAYTPSVGRDRAGHYWLAWYLLGPTSKARLNGLYLVRIDPSTLKPIGRPKHAPGSGPVANQSVRLALACAASCRLVYLAGSADSVRVVAWAAGTKKSTLVAEPGKGHELLDVAATSTASGRLWVAWYDQEDRSYHAVASGGHAAAIGHPTATGRFAGALGLTTVGGDLVLVVNWQGSGSSFARYANVVAPH